MAIDLGGILFFTPFILLSGREVHQRNNQIMARNLTADEFNQVPDFLKSEYTIDTETGEYMDSEATRLRNHAQLVLNEKKDLQRKLTDTARRNGDTEGLLAELNEREARFKSQAQKHAHQSAITSVVSELSDNQLFGKLIADRVHVEVNDEGEIITTYRDVKGRDTNMTRAEFVKALSQESDLSPFVRGTKAGGAGGDHRVGNTGSKSGVNGFKDGNTHPTKIDLVGQARQIIQGKAWR